MAVRQKRQTVKESHDLGCLRLYREDIRAIAAAVSEAGELRISCTDNEGTTYDASALEDLDELPEDVGFVISVPRPGESQISYSKPARIEVRLAPEKATVELVDPDTLTTGILVRIRNICASRRRRARSMLPQWGMYPWFGVFPPTVAAIAAFTLGNLPGAQNNKWAALNTVIVVVASLLIITSFSVGIFVRRPRVILINAPRASRPTYWERTRDMWWVGIITALIGALIGYVLPHP